MVIDNVNGQHFWQFAVVLSFFQAQNERKMKNEERKKREDLTRTMPARAGSEDAEGKRTEDKEQIAGSNEQS